MKFFIFVLVLYVQVQAHAEGVHFVTSESGRAFAASTYVKSMPRRQPAAQKRTDAKLMAFVKSELRSKKAAARSKPRIVAQQP